MADPELSYEDINPHSEITFLLIHGAFGSPKEFKLVPRYLLKHHLLIPSLPSHGSNASIKPFTPSLTARLLANLIRSHTKNGKAHVVGLSLGSHVALYLAAHYPDIVLTVFASGYARFDPPMWAPVLPYLVFGGHHLEALIPSGFKSYLMDGTDLDLEGTSICTPSLCRDVVAVIVSSEEPLPIKARTLIVAATKRGIVPSNDSVKDAMKVAVIMKTGNAESKLVEMKQMRHPWHMQAPELFARCIAAWAENAELPEDMLELEIRK